MLGNTAMSFESTSITYLLQLKHDEMITTTFLNLVLGYINRISFMTQISVWISIISAVVITLHF